MNPGAPAMADGCEWPLQDQRARPARGELLDGVPGRRLGIHIGRQAPQLANMRRHDHVLPQPTGPAIQPRQAVQRIGVEDGGQVAIGAPAEDGLHEIDDATIGR